MGYADEVRLLDARQPNNGDNIICETLVDEASDNDNNEAEDEENIYLVDFQQLIAVLQLCADFFQSQSPTRDGNAM